MSRKNYKEVWVVVVRLVPPHRGEGYEAIAYDDGTQIDVICRGVPTEKRAVEIAKEQGFVNVIPEGQPFPSAAKRRRSR